MIARDPQAAARQAFDLIVVGGGIYGAMLALEAAGDGRRPLLLERHDFGGETSWNSLRIVHGGLRYLQKADLGRFRDSVGERRWFLRHYPDLVRPLPCLMPLTGRGLRRPSVLRAALWLNDLLSARRNDGVPAEAHLPRGRVLDREQTLERFPGAATDGLSGAAWWHDAVMPDSQRVLIEALRWAVARGAVALNYVEAVEPIVAGNAVEGVRAIDRTDGQTLEFRAPLLVNAAGPHAVGFARDCDSPAPELFHPSVALNLFLDRGPAIDGAVAVDARRPGAQTFFLHAWKGGLLAGTWHAALEAGGKLPERPPAGEIEKFLDALSETLPGWKPTGEDVLRVHWGLLPACRPASREIARHPVVVDHGLRGGPQGLHSVSGVKFTTARLVARRLLDRVLTTAASRPAEEGPPRRRSIPTTGDLLAGVEAGRTLPEPMAERVRSLALEESVVHLADLMLRRTDWGTDPRVADRLADPIARCLGWTDERRRHEFRDYLDQESRVGADGYLSEMRRLDAADPAG